MPPKHDRKMRELAVELFDEGYGRDIVAARLCMSASIVEKWLLTYRSVGSEVLLSGRFSTLPTLLRIFMLMMREIGERTLYGKRWNSVSLCCKRFEGSAAVDHAPPQTNLLSFERKSLFFICNLFKIHTKKLHFYPVQ